MFISDSFMSWPGRMVLGMLVAGSGGVLAARMMPRGPVTTSQALITMGICLLVGTLAAVITGSNWSMLAAPVVYFLGVELGRPNLVGPTVGPLRLNEAYGILAFVLGRLLPGLLSLVTMLLGARLGLILRRMVSETPQSEGILAGESFLGLGLLSVVVIGLVILLLRPASTPPLLAESGQPIPGSISRLEKVSLGGQEQTVLIRAEDPKNPVLLYLSGGPGQSDLGYTRVLFRDLAEDFVVVSWDQRGTGKSYSSLDPTEELTFEQAVADTHELTEYLRKRFGEEKVYLLGESYGTILGVFAVQKRPDLYYAWIGSGQMVDITETDRRLYKEILAHADQQGDKDLKEKMEAYGQPPYEDIPYANGTVMGHYEALYASYTPPQAYVDRGREARLGFMNINSQEYNLVEKVNVLRGLVDMFTIMYPQLEEIDLRQDASELAVPVYILDGKAEVAARRDLTLDWFDILDAPRKRIYSFENAAHSVAFEQFQELHRILIEDILPETYPER